MGDSRRQIRLKGSQPNAQHKVLCPQAANPLHDLPKQPGGLSVFILPAVYPWVQELTQQIPMAAVKLHPIIARLPATPCRRNKVLPNPVNLLPGHLRPCPLPLGQMQGVGAGAKVPFSYADQPRMMELHKHRAARLMHRLHNGPQTGNLVIRPYPQLSRRKPPLRADAGGLLDDQPRASLGQGPIVGHMNPGSLRPLRAVEYHGRNANTVFQRYLAHGQRLSQAGQRCHVVPSLESTSTIPMALS